MYLVYPVVTSASDYTGAARHVKRKLVRPLAELNSNSRLLLTVEVLRAKREQYRFQVVFRVEYHVAGLFGVL